MELIQILWDLFMLREAKRKGQLNWQVWAFAISFVVVLYGIGVPAAVLYQNHPQDKPVFIAAMVLDGIVAVVGFVWAWKLYRMLQAKSNGVEGKVAIGEDEVVYSGTATRDEATALGNALKIRRYFQNHGVTVMLDKGAAGTAISFVVKEGSWNNPGLVCWFEDVTKEVAPVVGGLPVQLRFLNNSKAVEKSLTVDKVEKVVAGNDQVLYSGAATPDDATALDKALRDGCYFEYRGGTVQLDKGNGVTAISFMVQDGAWGKPGVLSAFEEAARELAPAVGGLPVQVNLLNRNMEAKKSSTIGKMDFGNDSIFYEGMATQADAQVLDQALKAVGFFTGAGADVFLTRHDDGTTLSFMVVEGAWDNPVKVSNFEDIARNVASAAGGLPIRLQLMNSVHDVKKEIMVR